MLTKAYIKRLNLIGREKKTEEIIYKDSIRAFMVFTSHFKYRNLNKLLCISWPRNTVFR